MKKLLFISCMAAGLAVGITIAEEEKDEKTEEKVIALTNEIEHQSELDDYLDAQRTKLYLDKSITTEQWKIEYADLQQQSLNLSEKERQEVLAERQQSVNQLIGYLIEKRFEEKVEMEVVNFLSSEVNLPEDQFEINLVSDTYVEQVQDKLTGKITVYVHELKTGKKTFETELKKQLGLENSQVNIDVWEGKTLHTGDN